MIERDSSTEGDDMPEITVTIEWDKPAEQGWLCPDNVAIALHAYCPKTHFKVTGADDRESEPEAE